MIDVTINGRQPTDVPPEDVRRAFREALRVARRADRGSVSLTYVSDTQMRALNRRYRRKHATTDVLSFAPTDMPGLSGVPRHWGDIFVSPAYVRHEARRRGIAFHEEVLRVAIHGMLHLFGYDHATEAEEMRMFTLQERALDRVLMNV